MTPTVDSTQTIYYPKILSHWPIKFKHKLFSPQKVHVQMRESLAYEMKLIVRVSSPSISNNIIVPR